MTIEEKQKLIASKVHESVLAELNANMEFKSEALKEYLKSLHNEDADLDEFCLLPKNEKGGNCQILEGNQFTIESYSFALQKFSYTKKLKRTGLTARASITTNNINGNYSEDNSEEIVIKIESQKLVSEYEVADRIEIQA